MAGELARLRGGRPPAEIAALLTRLPPPSPADGGADDRLEPLLDLQPDGAAYVETLSVLCLLRALAHIATPEAVATLAPVALDARGAFAVDVQRYLSALGERASAGLVLMSHSRSPAQAKWASAELEALGKRTPGDAVQTKSKEVLADVLVAYGATKDADALPVVMSFINADRRIVRDAARESIARYDDLAGPKLREAYGLLAGEAAPPDWPPVWLRQKLFEALDRVRLEDVDARVKSGLRLTSEGNLEEAVAAFDDVLARQPDWDRKAELVPAYVFLGQSLVATDPARARFLLEKALRLDPLGPRAPQVESALAFLEGKELEKRGITDVEPFRRALEKDPSNAAAGAELLRLAEDTLATEKRWQRRLWMGGGALVAVSFLVLFVGGRRSVRSRVGRRTG
jgi:tetratricopeptide (TPR) repeat protein